MRSTMAGPSAVEVKDRELFEEGENFADAELTRSMLAIGEDVRDLNILAIVGPGHDFETDLEADRV